MMLKVLDRRGGFSAVDVSPVYENVTAAHPPRRSQRHGGLTSANPTADPALTLDDRNILQRLSGAVRSTATSDASDEAEPQSSSGSSTLAGAAALDTPRRSQRSHKRSRFMDDDYLSSMRVGRTTNGDDVKVLEQRRRLANEPAVKKRSLKIVSSTEMCANNSPKSAILPTSPTQRGVSRVSTRRSLGPVVRYPIGTRLNVKYGAVNPQVYEAKVIEVDVVSQVPRYRVHYRGWNKSHDSWITKIDVVSVIEKPSSLATATSGEPVRPPSSDITPKISTKVFPADCRASARGLSRDLKINVMKEMEQDAQTHQGKKRKQEEEKVEKEEEDGENLEIVWERESRSGRKRMASTNESLDGEASRSSSNGSMVAEESEDAESDATGEEDGSSGMELGAEEGIVDATVTTGSAEPELDGCEGSGQDGEKSGCSGTEEEEIGEEDGQKGANDEGVVNGISEDSGPRNDNDGDAETGDVEEDGAKVEEDGAEERHSSGSEDQSAALIILASEAENCESTRSNEEIERLPEETSSILRLNLGRLRSNRKPAAIYSSLIQTSESSCGSDSMQRATFGCDNKTTVDDSLDNGATLDDLSTSNSNSDDACNELLPAETDSIVSGGTSSIASDTHHRLDRGGNATSSTTTNSTTTTCSTQLDDAECTRHFATLRSSPAYRTNIIDLEAELKGLDEAEKEDYILSKMRKIQTEYRHMSSMYNKLTRRCNRAGNRKKSRSRRHESIAVATADTEASPVC